ncbi:hypothetical protein BDFB_013474 [Asbolus verrucosus]|uniref:Uncharacterized protein n=1 Tax=Asbolus verrucosus TaxID=1661398 RepID=A0A482VJ03_ASBVE|nr:hypothetical protein BDFB_013474 [Asbolus verrucosus]
MSYTGSTVLVATTNSTSNFINYILNIDINLDDCCIRKINVIKSEDMKPINLKILNLEDLQRSHDKLFHHNFEYLLLLLVLQLLQLL